MMKFKNKLQKHTVVNIILYRDIVVRFHLRDQRLRQQRSSKVKQYVLVKINMSCVIKERTLIWTPTTLTPFPWASTVTNGSAKAEHQLSG